MLFRLRLSGVKGFERLGVRPPVWILVLSIRILIPLGCLFAVKDQNGNIIFGAEIATQFAGERQELFPLRSFYASGDVEDKSSVPVSVL
jgi:hypothetical protein